jgi:hypothetical protein
MLADPGRYEERCRLTAGAHLAAGLITIGLVFLTVAPWVTGVVITELYASSPGLKGCLAWL